MSNKPMVFNYQEYERLKKRTRWIPVTEGMPDECLDESTTVLITFRDFDHLDTDTAWTINGAWHWNATGCEAPVPAEVIAWMPLPEPYTGGDTDDAL